MGKDELLQFGSREELVEVIEELRNQITGTCGMLDRTEDARRTLEKGAQNLEWNLRQLTKMHAHREKAIVGFVLQAFGEAVNRGDKTTAEVLDALATTIEQSKMPELEVSIPEWMKRLGGL